MELETGCGIVPYRYEERAAVSALQWAVGLELFLLASDPWRVVLSTDSPNGGSFVAYPALIQLLMDRSVRDEQLKRVNQRATGRERAGRRPRAGSTPSTRSPSSPARGLPGCSA